VVAERFTETKYDIKLDRMEAITDIYPYNFCIIREAKKSPIHNFTQEDEYKCETYISDYLLHLPYSL
jgi:hypothetical protein